MRSDRRVPRQGLAQVDVTLRRRSSPHVLCGSYCAAASLSPSMATLGGPQPPQHHIDLGKTALALRLRSWRLKRCP